MWWCKLRRKPLVFRLRSSWYSFRAMLGSTVDTCPASALGCFWRFFLRVCGTRLLKSILSCSPVWGAAFVVDLGCSVCLLVLLVTVHLALCSLRFCWPENGEVAQTMLRLLYLPRSGNYFHEPLVPCSHLFAVRALCRGVLGALDDEEFFVEGSKWRGRREFDSHLTCHPN